MASRKPGGRFQTVPRWLIHPTTVILQRSLQLESRVLVSYEVHIQVRSLDSGAGTLRSVRFTEAEVWDYFCHKPLTWPIELGLKAMPSSVA